MIATESSCHFPTQEGTVCPEARIRGSRTDPSVKSLWKRGLDMLSLDGD